MAAAPPSVAPTGERERPAACVAAGVLAVLASAASVVFALLALAAFRSLGLVPGVASGMTAGYWKLLALGLPLLVALGLLIGGVGLLAARPWAWWTCLWFALLAILNAARVASPLLTRIDRDHARAAEAATKIVVSTGVPALAAASLLVLLALPPVRLACGVRRAQPARRRRRVGAGPRRP